MLLRHSRCHQGEGPDVGGSPSSHQCEGPVHVVESLEMPSGRGPNVGGSPSSRHGDRLVYVVETLEMLSG